jgi:acetyl-CoA synthetase
MVNTQTIAALLEEERTFPPPQEFKENANINDPRIYEIAARDPEAFWAKAAEELDWFKKWEKVLEWDPPWAKWFIGGKLNASYNCIDRHLKTWRRNKAAIIFEGEPGDERVLTYQDLHREVCKFANVLKKLGIKKGDRVAIYLPMIPELPIAMLACARIGAVHSVVFGGFSAEALRDRINDAQAKLLITADGGWRRGHVVPLKKNADEALKQTPSIKNVIVVRRVGDDTLTLKPSEFWWHELMRDAPLDCPPEPMDSEDMLFILYTSGTTGKPKGVVHTTGGYLVGTALTHKWIFDIKDEDVYWCTADIGWVTGTAISSMARWPTGRRLLCSRACPDYPTRIASGPSSRSTE